MKNKSSAILYFFLLVAFAANVCAQNQSVSLNRQRIAENSSKDNSTVNTFALEKLVFQLVNRQRAANGLPEVIWSDEVAKVARVHSQNMAKYKFFEHRGLDGLMVTDRAYSLGVKNWWAIGENLALNRGFANPTETTVESWMKSIAHRKNILAERWKESGVGIARAADDSLYFTQVFLVKK